MLVTVMDRNLMDDYLAMTWELRRAGIPTELYVGTAKTIWRIARCGPWTKLGTVDPP